MNEDHNSIAERARSDEEAFTTLYHLYFNEIYGFVMKRVGHRETAEDLVSEIFRKVFLHLDTFQSEKASFRTWLYRIAGNTVIDHYRSHRNTPAGAVVDIEEAFFLETNDGSPLDHVLTKEQKDFVHGALQKLVPPTYQSVLQLKFFDELSNKEIAEILEIAPNNVGVLIHRALKKLRKNLEYQST